MKLSEIQKKAICDHIEKSLKSATLINYRTSDDDELPLVDFLSFGDTIKDGEDEIENLVEHIYFDMDNWEI